MSILRRIGEWLGLVTPESVGHEMAALLRSPADPDELRADSGVVTRILNAERRLALVEMAGGAVVAVPYGVGRPVVGHRYPVYSTPAGDRWMKAGGQTWCKTWTVNEDFNEEGAEFEGDMLDPALRFRLELAAFRPFGDGADGAAVHNLDGGDVDLGSVSICGRSAPDAAWDTVVTWAGEQIAAGVPAGKIGPEHGIPAGLVEGDEVLIYVAQVKADGPDSMVGLVGHWEVHRVSLIAGGFIWYEDYVAAIPTGIEDTITYVQRVPNYTTISQSGSLNASAITCGAHNIPYGDPGAGTGVVCVRASVSSAARYTAIGKGYAGGANGENCVDMGADGYWEHGNPGHGQRAPNGADGDGGAGVFGGGGAGGNEDCLTGPLNAAHVAAYGHTADSPSVGGGGGHATAGIGPSGITQHARAPHGMHYAGRPDGNAGAAIGQAELMAGAAFHGNACFGGGGGAAGNYFLVSEIQAGPGGDGGGFVAVFAASFQNNGGGGFTIPTIDVNGTQGGFISGGGAAGSIIVYAETLGSALGLDPWLMAETVDVVGASQGYSGLGGSLIGNADVSSATPGRGAVGRVQVHYTATKHGYTANGSVNETSGALAYAGCWASALYHSALLDLPSGMRLEPLTLRAAWTLDSGGIAPTFYLIGGDQPDLSDGVVYPQPAPAYWQDGGTHDIDDDTDLDLTPYALTPALYWRAWACLDGGADTGDTPTVESLTLCGTAS